MAKLETGQTDGETTKVVLDVEVAEEVVDLIRDRPGTADEDLLDEALAAIEAASPRVPATDQQRAARGQAVAIQVEQDTADAMRTLISDNRAVKRSRLRRAADRLGGKLDRAKARRRRGK